VARRVAVVRRKWQRREEKRNEEKLRLLVACFSFLHKMAFISPASQRPAEEFSKCEERNLIPQAGGKQSSNCNKQSLFLRQSDEKKRAFLVERKALRTAHLSSEDEPPLC